MKIFDWSRTIGICTFFAVLLFANFLQMPIACVDGWHSPSIGARGACSYHGGVGHGSMLWFLVSIVAGLGAWRFAEWNSPRRQSEEEGDRLRKLAEAEAIELKWTPELGPGIAEVKV
jgi:hypothetical protein